MYMFFFVNIQYIYYTQYNTYNRKKKLVQFCPNDKVTNIKTV